MIELKAEDTKRAVWTAVANSEAELIYLSPELRARLSSDATAGLSISFLAQSGPVTLLGLQPHCRYSLRVRIAEAEFDCVLTRIPSAHELEHTLLLEAVDTAFPPPPDRELPVGLQAFQAIGQLGFWEWDPKADRLSWSSNLYLMAGVDPESFSPDLESVLALIHPEDREALRANIWAGREADTETSAAFRLLKPDGSVAHFQLRRRPFFDAQGRLERVRGVILDVSDEREQQAAMLARKTRLQTFLDHSPDAIVIVNLEGQIVYANHRADVLFGYPHDSLQGRSIEDLIPERFRHDHVQHRQQYHRAPSHRSMNRRWELMVLRADGTEFPVEVMLNAVRLGDRVKILATVRDISALKAAERQIRELNASLEEKVQQRTQELERTNRALIEAQQQAEQANQAKSIFLASMSHEIRTPLNAILGFAQLLDMSRLEDNQHRQVQSILSAGEHLLGLINEVLDISRIEAGKVELNLEDFYLETLLEEVLRLFQQRFAARDLYFRCELKAPSSKSVRSDYAKLKQIMINLVGNALKFTETGGVTLRLTWLEEPEQKRLCLEVEDTGPGIEPDYLGQIFSRFGQTPEGQKRSDSSGLGLNICRTYAQLLGGDIEVESNWGEGTLFRVCCVVEEGLAPLIHPDRSGRKRQLDLAADETAPLLLVVDDVEANRALLLDFLQWVGFRLLEAHGGAEALELIRTERPQGVLLDMGMPDVSGFDVLAELGQVQERPKLIALTASAFEEERKQVLASGADAFLSKPFRFPHLLDTLSEVLGVRYLELEAGSTVIRDQIHEPSTLDRAEENRAAAPELSSVWLEQMLAALAAGDMDEMQALLTELDRRYLDFADRIQDCLNNFDYETLERILEQELQRLNIARA